MKRLYKNIIPNLKFTGTDGKKRMFGFVFFVFWLAVLILTIFLPPNILEVAPILRKFVNFMADIFPPVNSFGKYSEFPQVSQLIYSMEIPTIPFLTILFYINLKPDSSKINKDKLFEKPIKYLVIAPIIGLWTMLFPLFSSLKPGGNNHIMIFLTSFYHSRLMYSFGSVLLISGSAFFVYFFIVYLTGIYHLAFKYNRN